jgi:hypothetical protein
MRGAARNRWTRDSSGDELGADRKQRILLVEIGPTGRGGFGLASPSTYTRRTCHVSMPRTSCSETTCGRVRWADRAPVGRSPRVDPRRSRPFAPQNTISCAALHLAKHYERFVLERTEFFQSFRC